ncbi:hypothetical protein [Burkholderia sp. USMB20]|uniref:hypothetical protein n=1 Tax=Burkholderia sp. USMB20 TaxID=1571773 RepID=UPI0009E2D05C|nr:hypothetical protein [Burkholderia sp. USMB20]TGN96101.1 hypothetical protein PL79_018820 [Burkholderia sp. USMB20]
MSLQKLRDLIANDGYAITFQSMAAYRNALLAAFPVAHPAAATADERSTIACQVHSGADCIECGGTGVWLVPADAQPRVQRDTDKRIGLLFESKEAADHWKARAAASPAAAAATTSIATEALKALMRACDARELPFLRTPAEMLASIVKWELDEQPAQADTPCKCRNLGDLDGTHHPLCDAALPKSAAPATEQATIPEPTDDVLCACGWETWNSLGSYVDRGTATARYRTIAAFVLEGISSPAPLAQHDALQTRGAQ